MTRFLLCAALAAAPLAALPAQQSTQQSAQQSTPPSPAPVLSASARQSVIDSLARALERRYVDADTARLIAGAVRARLRAGAYDSLVAPEAFGRAVTRDLRSVNGDLHLGLRWAPDGRGSMGEGRDEAAWIAEAKARNYGIAKVEVLEGNVGYLEIRAFMGAPGYEAAVVEALRKLAGTDAVIIDLRRNGGGSGEMSHFVFSHFLGATPVETIHVVDRGEGTARTMTSLAAVPGPRRPDVPLYLLTSGFTASAGEEFSFVLRNQGRATLVGERTAGAGHMVGRVPVGHGFAAGISITRVTDPRTGREWERVGVEPHLPTESAKALDAALDAARAAIRERTAARPAS